MKYIVTGTRTGLGRYLHETLPNSLGINRENLNLIISRINPEDIIIHCAFNKTNKIEDYNAYLDDNIFLTKRLSELGNRIVYISSVDVYFQDNIYSLFKKFGEALISKCANSLILRCPALVGKYMTPNHLFKLKSNQPISLSGDSVFNYILYSDILDTIRGTGDKNGTYDLVSKENVNINTIKDVFQSDSNLGTYLYTTPNQFTNPIEIQRTSVETIKSYFI